MYECGRCKEKFIRTKSEINRGRTKFCSRKCSDLHKKEAADNYAIKVLKAGRKQCKMCGKTRKLVNFPRSKQSRIGYFSYCYDCRHKINKEQNFKRLGQRKKYSREAYLKREYGITNEQYIRMLHDQGGGCAICKCEVVRKSHAVDHDHVTGEIRGILCDNCNRGLGMFKDRQSLLICAVKYLQKTTVLDTE